MACSSSLRKPAASTVSASSLILDNWRAFISALTEQGRSLRTCAKGSSWFMQMVAVSVDVPFWISLNLNAPTTPATQFGFKVSVRPGASFVRAIRHDFHDSQKFRCTPPAAWWLARLGAVIKISSCDFDLDHGRLRSGRMPWAGLGRRKTDDGKNPDRPAVDRADPWCAADLVSCGVVTTSVKTREG